MYILTVFFALGRVIKFVLSVWVAKVTKQNVFHNPGIYTKSTYLHSHDLSRLVTPLIKGHLILFYMYICKILNITKRSRNFFAMQGIEGGLSDLLLLLLMKKNYISKTRIYISSFMKKEIC